MSHNGSTSLPDFVPEWAIDLTQTQQPATADIPSILEPEPDKESTVGLELSPKSKTISHLSVTSISPSNRITISSPSGADDASLNSTDPGSRRIYADISSTTVKNVTVYPTQGRDVHRKLRAIHIAMIAVNATVGSGLYWRGGQVLELGGPLSTLLAFLLPGILAWGVMQCITEMLCIWPIPGALSVYVSEFVDVELGIGVGCLYWFTYASSFAALITTCAAEMQYWKPGDKAFYGTVVYFLIPTFLVLLNCLRVDIYGWFEVISSCIKLVFLLVIIFIMIVLNLRGEIPKGTTYWSTPTEYDHVAATNWANAFIMSIPIATFAYVGVEVVAASALEARWPDAKTEDESHRTDTNLSNSSIPELLIGQTMKFSSIYIPVIITIAYVLAGVLASFNIHRSDSRLPRLSWQTSSIEARNSEKSIHPPTKSVFVIIAEDANLPPLETVINVFLVFTALTCACTNLYVASRTLFGLTTRLDYSPDQPLILRFLAWFGKTNRFRVPMRAVIFSAVSFCWVPFLQLDHMAGNSSTASRFIEILTTMASDSVIIVWALECWAFIRYYHCIEKYRTKLEDIHPSQVDRWRKDYPYRSHLQPMVAYASLAGCIFVLVVGNSSFMWKSFHPTPFLSTFLLQIVFICLMIALKFQSGSWWLVDLSNPNVVAQKIRKLNDIRLGSTMGHDDKSGIPLSSIPTV